jgi:Polysaccharide deacetylase
VNRRLLLLLAIPAVLVVGAVAYAVTSSGGGGNPVGRVLPSSPSHSLSPSASPSPATDDSVSGAAPQTDAPLPAAAEGLAPVVSRIPTTQPVIFLGIDDGIVKDPKVQQLIVSKRLPVTLFLTLNFVKNDYAYFKPMIDAGATVEDHTVSHPNLKTLSYAAQKQQFCPTADAYAQAFGRRPLLGRPPFGNFNRDTQRAAHDCGLKYLVNWHVNVRNNGILYQEGNKLLPGDILLLHFRTTLYGDLQVVLNQCAKQGLKIAKLEDYLL